jgi:hypothetical protein
MKSKKNFQWENVTGKYSTVAKTYYLPENADDVATAVKACGLSVPDIPLMIVRSLMASSSTCQIWWA